MNDWFYISVELGNYAHTFYVDYNHWELDYFVKRQSILILRTLAFEVINADVIKGCLVYILILLHV